MKVFFMAANRILEQIDADEKHMGGWLDGWMDGWMGCMLFNKCTSGVTAPASRQGARCRMISAPGLCGGIFCYCIIASEKTWGLVDRAIKSGVRVSKRK